MVPADSSDRSLVHRALTRVPDLPRWIDTRGMLLSGRAVVATGGEPELSSDGFVVFVPDAALASIVGRPAANTIRDSVASLSGEVNVLSQMEDAEHAAAALPQWRRRAAILHVLPETQPWEVESDPQACVFTRETAPRFDHLPEPLQRELTDALRGRTVSRFVAGELPPSAVASTVLAIPMAAAWTDGRPVSFCYPVWQTETRWDVAVDVCPWPTIPIILAYVKQLILAIYTNIRGLSEVCDREHPDVCDKRSDQINRNMLEIIVLHLNTFRRGIPDFIRRTPPQGQPFENL